MSIVASQYALRIKRKHQDEIHVEKEMILATNLVYEL